MAIYGDNELFKDCQDAFDALMDSLKTAMDGASTTPRPAAIYNGHNNVKMSLPAISVGLAMDEGSAFVGDIQGDKIQASGGIITAHNQIALTIRVHTSYHRGAINYDELRDLVNSIINYLEVNIDTPRSTIEGTSNVSFLFYTIGDIILGDDFEDTLTMGATIPILIDVTIGHTQI